MSTKLKELVEFARNNSPFYKELYKLLPEKLPADAELLKILPVVESKSFWTANSLDDNKLLTAPMDDGIVFKSGGTSGAPKFSVFAKEEWNQFCHSFGTGLSRGGVKSSERVANLFYVGELYASFIFIMKSFELGTQTLQLPIAGATEIEKMVHQILELKATTLAGTPSTMVQIAEFARKHQLKFPHLNKFLFGGEQLYQDQRDLLLEIFPNSTVQSIGYASVDAGLLGYADESCAPGEHRVFGEETIYEILDPETYEVIVDEGVEGKAFITYLSRRLMPIIRYPVGDQAKWVEPSNVLDRKFQLVGRSEEAARVGPVSLYYDDLFQLFSREPFNLSGLQILISHHQQKDQLTLRMVFRDNVSSKDVLSLLLKEREMIDVEVKKGHIHLPLIEIIEFDQLERNPRTGKMLRVIDRRL